MIPLIPETAPFTEVQRQWLNGFFAGLMGGIQSGQSLHSVGSTDLPTHAIKKSLTVPIYFASQSGNSEDLAHKLAKILSNSKETDVSGEARSIEKFTPEELEKLEYIVLISSTWGDGDLPDSALSFGKWLKESKPSLKNLKYALLGLGDTEYKKFCNAAVVLDHLFKEAGATPTLELVKCDKDYEEKAQLWIESVHSYFKEKIPRNSEDIHHVDISPLSSKDENFAQRYDKHNPYYSVFLENRRLTGYQSAKDIRHFSFSLMGSEITYLPGDTVGIVPTNSFELVDQIILSLNCQGRERISLKNGKEMNLRRALLSELDLYKVPKALLELYLRCCKDHQARHQLNTLLDPQNEEDLYKYLKSHDVLDVIQTFNRILIDPQDFVMSLSKLTPRLYSIASSQKYISDEVHLTVGIVKDVLKNRLRKGVSSNYLGGQVALGESIPIYFNDNHHFRLPNSGDIPIIMVGPGTGIAPFRAFLQERTALGCTGKNWLFFGNPHSSTDFLYQEELREFQQKGILTNLSTAFSRDQEQKIYVQDRILENAAKLFAWLENGAHFYICGDAKRMAVDVENALLKVIETEKNCTAEESREYLTEMKKSKRYQKDVY